jgi:hypothetical protein
MIRVAREHLFEVGDQLDRARLGLAAHGPVLPRTEIHARLGVDRQHVEVVGEAA